MVTQDPSMTSTEPENQEDDPNLIKDVLASPVRGVEGAVQGLYNLADYVVGDKLPDYDTRFLGRSATMPGGALEGIFQFLAGFIPIAGQLGRVGRIARARKLFGGDVAKQLTKDASQLSTKQLAAINKTSKRGDFARGFTAGVGSDFLAFDGQEERLSNFLAQYPAFQNPVVEYLQSTGDENQIEGRFKNVLEGLFLEIGASALLKPFIKGIKTIKTRGKKVAEGKPKEDATDEAIAESELTEEELLNVEPPVGRAADEGEARAPDEEPDAPTVLETEVVQDEVIPLNADQKKDLGFPEEPLDANTPINPDLEARTENLNAQLAADFEIGGKQALLSAMRLVSKDSDMYALVRGIAVKQEKLAEEGGFLAKTTEKEMFEEAEELVESLGGNVNEYTASYKKLAAKGSEYAKQFNRDQMAVKTLNNLISENLSNLARETQRLIKGSDAHDAKMVEIFHGMTLLNSSQQLWALFGRTGSLAQLQRKYIYKRIEDRSFLSIPSEITPQDVARFREQQLGSMSDDKLIALLMTAKSSDEIQHGINKIVKGSFGGSKMDMVQEYWMNSLLSGPSTQLVNLIGSAVTYSLSTIEKTVGAALSGNFELAKATMRYSFSMNAIADAWQLAGRALKTGEAISLPDARSFDDAAAQRKAISYFDPTGENGFATAFNFLGTIVRLPSRGLMGGDEFFKAFNYRIHVQTELAAEAIQKGLKGEARAKYVADRLNGYVTETGRVFNEGGIIKDLELKAKEKGLSFGERDEFIKKELAKIRDNPIELPDGSKLSYEDRGVIAARAEQVAKVNTHTQDSKNSVANALGRLATKHPTLKFVVPFVRTPTNILTYGVSRSPLGNLQLLSKEFRAELRNPDPIAQAQARGKLATSVTTTAALLYFLQSGEAHKYITGFGPKNKEQRESWELENQQYSIKVGDKWVSYNRLDPVATMLGIVADINEAQTYNELDDGELGKVFSVVALAFANNITNKSYVQGISNLFEFIKFKDPVKDAERFVGGIAGGFVPNVVNQAMNFDEERTIKEARGIVDRIIKRTPAGGSLPPRRNVLGEPIESAAAGFFGPFNPFHIKDDPKNIVNHELANLRAGFRQPQSKLRPGVEELDMREYYNPETGQQAYDRFLELVGTSKMRGKTLRERLETMFRSKEYQALPEEDLKDETGSDSPKVKAIRRLISAYRSIAKYQTLSENPELKQREIEAIRKAQAQQ